MGRSWTFGQKLGAGFGLMVVLALALSGISMYALDAVIERKDAVIDVRTQNLLDAERMSTATWREIAAVRAYLLTGVRKTQGGVRTADQQFEAALERVRARGLGAELAPMVSAIESAERFHQREVDEILELRAQDAPLAEIIKRFDARIVPAAQAIETALDEFANLEQDLSNASRDEANATARSSMQLLATLAAMIVGLAIVSSWLLTRALSTQIGSSVHHVRSSAAELQATAGQQATSAREQASAMQEITTTIGELLASSRQIADSAQRVARIASDTADGARAGDQTVGNAREALDDIRAQVDKIVQHMLGLGRKSQEIGGILEVINELAEQTNILAINATIEASGAGDAGRRFAVVGEEIRKLADRVGTSTKDIRGLIEEIRAAVNTTVMATETGSKTVEAGAARFAELADAFRQIGEAVDTTTEAAREIELSTRQQTTGVEQVNTAVSNVAQATQETEAGSTQTLQTASQLTTLANELARLVQARAA